MKNDAQEVLRLYQAELVHIRRDLHAHPELGFEETRTAQLVADKLAEWGVEVHRGLAKTGVVGTLRRGNATRSIGLRADMDALPVVELANVAYKSAVKTKYNGVETGVMHACGHDMHTAMLMGAAEVLAGLKSQISGTVVFLFQPAEEGLGGGEAMIKDGLFERFPCDSIFGMHNWPGLSVGKFAIRPGGMMAGGA